MAAKKGLFQKGDQKKQYQPIQETVADMKLPEPEFLVRKSKTPKRKTDIAMRVRATEKSRKLSQPEIQVRTGNLEKKLSQPEFKALTESQIAFAPEPVADALKAVKELEVDPEPHAHIESQENSAAFFKPQNYRRDLKKTQLLSIPKQGIRRSHRGTIEAVFQPDGKIVEAQYNRCGILIEVSVAGAIKLTRSAQTGEWTMSYCDGSQPNNRVLNVAFDRLGNLFYSTEDGHTTVICADGRVVEK